MILVVSHDHRLFVIHMDTVRVVELVRGLPGPVSSSDGDPVRCPSGRGCNEREVCVLDRFLVTARLVFSPVLWRALSVTTASDRSYIIGKKMMV